MKVGSLKLISSLSKENGELRERLSCLGIDPDSPMELERGPESEPEKPQEMIAASCGNCHWFRQREVPSESGRCYRFPPVVHPNYAQLLPVVSESHFCGEFKQF